MVDDYGKGKISKFVDTATLAVVVAVVLIVGGRWFKGLPTYRFGITEPPKETLSSVMADSTEPIPGARRLSRAEVLDLQQYGVDYSDEWPAVRIIVLEDLGCGWCAEFESSLASVASKYPDHVMVVHVPFVRDTISVASMDAHMGLHCAEEQGYSDSYRSEAYFNQELVTQRDGWNTIGSLVRIPSKREFQSCVVSGRYRDKILHGTRLAYILGFEVTPSAIVGRWPVIGSTSVETIDSLVGLGLQEFRAR